MTEPTVIALDASAVSALEQTLIGAASTSALCGAGLRVDLLGLFRPHVEDFLRADLVTGAVVVVDAAGNARTGMTPAALAEEVRVQFDTLPGRFFSKR